MLTLPYLMALQDLCLNFKVLAVEQDLTLIRVAVQREDTQALNKIECPVPLNKESLIKGTQLSNLLMSMPELGYTKKNLGIYPEPEYYLAQRLVEDLLSEVITTATLSRDSTAHLWVVNYKAFGELRVSKIKSQLSYTTLLRLHTAAYYLRQGYSVQELVGQGYVVTSPTGVERQFLNKSCNCQEFNFDLKQKQPCKHLCLVEVFTQYRHILNKYTN